MSYDSIGGLRGLPPSQTTIFGQIVKLSYMHQNPPPFSRTNMFGISLVNIICSKVKGGGFQLARPVYYLSMFIIKLIN